MNTPRLLRRAAFAALCLLAFRSAEAQVNLAWANRYDGASAGVDVVNDVAADASGNVYVTGSVMTGSGFTDALTIKYNAAGAQQWVAQFDGLGAEHDEGIAVKVDASGHVYVAMKTVGFGTGLDMVAVKYNSAGTEVWRSGYTTSGNAPDEPAGIAVDASGIVYLTGTSGSGSGNFVLRRINAAGGSPWTEFYAGGGVDTAMDVKITSAGLIVVAGRTDGGGLEMANTSVVAWNSSGVQQWVATYNGGDNTDDLPQAMAVDGAGNTYVALSSKSTVSGVNADAVAVKISGTGTTTWTNTFAGTGSMNDIPHSIAVDAAGNVVFAGVEQDDAVNSDWFVRAVDSANTELFTLDYDSGGEDAATSVALDSTGDLYITGTSDGAIRTTRRTIAGNSEVWLQTYSGGAPAGSQRYRLALDSGPSVYVAGSLVFTGFPTQDYMTLRYEQGFPPLITTTAATAVGNTTATLNATVTPGGIPTSVEFFLDTMPVGIVNAGSSYGPVNVSLPVSGLSVHTTYSCTSTATNAAGSGNGGAVMFMTDNAAPVANDDIAIYSGGALIITVRANDSDADMDPLVITAVTQGVHGTVTHDGLTVTYTATGVFPGEDTFTYTITDGNAEFDTATVTVTSGVPTILVKYFGSGTSTTATGDSAPNLAPGYYLKSFGIPSIESGNFLAWVSVVKPPTGYTIPTLNLYDGTSTATLQKGDAMPGTWLGATGPVTFANFKDPLTNPNHDSAFTGIAKGAGLNLITNQGLILRTGTGTLSLVQQKGVAANDIPGTVVTGFPSAVLSQYEDSGPQPILYYVANLKPGVGPVTTLDNQILYAHKAGVSSQVVRKGGTVIVNGSPKTVKLPKLLLPFANSVGHQHGVNNEGDAIFVTTFTDATSALLESVAGAPAALLDPSLVSGGNAPVGTWKTFQAYSKSNAGIAILAALQGSGVTAASNVAIALVDGSGSSFIARKGDPAPSLPGLTLSAFKGPVINDAGTVAFIGSVAGSGVTAANRNVVCVKELTGTLSLVARAGDTAPGTPGCIFASFTNLALPGQLGGVFTAKLVTGPLGTAGPGGADKFSNVGIWARNRVGNVQLVQRTGDTITAGGSPRVIKTITYLGTNLGTNDQGRGYSEDRRIAYRVTFTDGTQALLQAIIP